MNVAWNYCRFATTCEDCLKNQYCGWCNGTCAYNNNEVPLTNLPMASALSNLRGLDVISGQCSLAQSFITDLDSCPASNIITLH